MPDTPETYVPRTLKSCEDHVGEIGFGEKDFEESYPLSCPQCGCLIDLIQCSMCYLHFPDWGSQSCDDVMAAPSFTISGDFMCVRCADRWEEEEEQEYEPEEEELPDG